MNECGSDRAVYPAAERHHYPARLANLRCDAAYRVLHKCGRRPVGPAAADVYNEVFKDLAAIGAVRNLRVKLDAINRLRRKIISGPERGYRDAFRARNQRKAFRQRLDAIAVAHPYL